MNMPSSFPRLILYSTIFLIGVAAATAQSPTRPDYKTLAERIVAQSAQVKEGDRVLVRGDLRDFELIEEIALAAAKRGAEAMQVVAREKTGRRYADEVPPKYDTMPLSLSIKLAEVQTVDISIEGQEDPGMFRDVPPDRIANIMKRFETVLEARLKANVRVVSLGNGLYPTEATAKALGLSKKQLEQIFWDGVNVDYAKLQATAAKLRAMLEAGREVRVTHPNGTDFRVRIEGRKVFTSDGVISPEDVAKGGPAVQVWLPAGEVYVTPVPGTAEGKIVFDTIPFESESIEGFTLTIKEGKMTALTAKPSAAYARWKALYDAAPPGKEEFGLVDLGINPNIKVPPGSKLTSWVPAGTVTLTTGGNSWAGGSNTSMMGAGGSMNGATVTVDGKPIVDKGELKVQ